MSQNNDAFNPLDPAGLLKGMRDAQMDAWSKMMIELVNSEGYARATGALLDAWLGASGPFRQALESSMTQVLTGVNLPTRDDITRLAERLTNIEMRLDDLDAKLDAALRAGRKGAGGPRAKPGPVEKHT
jgi:hypothetical protein